MKKNISLIVELIVITIVTTLIILLALKLFYKPPEGIQPKNNDIIQYELIDSVGFSCPYCGKNHFFPYNELKHGYVILPCNHEKIYLKWLIISEQQNQRRR